MKSYNRLLLAAVTLFSACCLSACSTDHLVDTTALLPVAGSYGQVEKVSAEPTKSLSKPYTTEYFSFPYDPGAMTITDLSDSSVTGAYFLVEPRMESHGMTHLELFGGEKITVPEDYSGDNWSEYAKELVSSYYAEPERVQMSVTAADLQREDGLTMSATIHVEALDDVPAMTAEVRAINGTESSIIMVFMQYETDEIYTEPYFDLMDNIKVY